MSDQFAYATEEAKQARAAVNNATDHGQKALADALSAAERTVSCATIAAARVLNESLGALRARTSSYTEEARRRFEDGERYVAEHVKQRPLTAALAGLGVGLLLGLLLASRTKS